MEELFNFLTQQRREAGEIQSVFIAAGSKVLKCPAERNHLCSFWSTGNKKLSRRAVLHCACFDLMLLRVFLFCFYKKGIHTVPTV